MHTLHFFIYIPCCLTHKPESCALLAPVNDPQITHNSYKSSYFLIMFNLYTGIILSGTLFMGSRDSNTGNGLGNGMGALGRETSTLGGSFSLTANNQWTPRNASAQTTGQAASLK